MLVKSALHEIVTLSVSEGKAKHCTVGRGPGSYSSDGRFRSETSATTVTVSSLGDLVLLFAA